MSKKVTGSRTVDRLMTGLLLEMGKALEDSIREKGFHECGQEVAEADLGHEVVREEVTYKHLAHCLKVYLAT